jgi:hypothetical protein
VDAEIAKVLAEASCCSHQRIEDIDEDTLSVLTSELSEKPL